MLKPAIGRMMAGPMSKAHWVVALAGVGLAVSVGCTSEEKLGPAGAAADGGGAESSRDRDALADEASAPPDAGVQDRAAGDASPESDANRTDGGPGGNGDSGSSDVVDGRGTMTDSRPPEIDGGGPIDVRTDVGNAGDSGDAADDGRTDGSLDAARPTDTMAGAARVSGHHMGTAVKAELLDSTAEPQYTTVLTRHFDALVSEYQMKWGTTEPMRGQFTFAPGDTIVAFAERHGMIVKGHTLVWHQNLPAWVSALGAGELGPALDAHIAGVAGHWKGKLYAWDVVNEAIADDGTGYRDTIFFQQLGAGYIERAFRAARAADPTALLFYNDYGAEALNAKSNRVHTMLRDLKNAGVPIDGVGLQFHLDAAAVPSMADVATNLDRLIALGLSVNYSEIDIRVGNLTGTTAQKLATQRTIYHDLIALCAARPKCHSASTWGFTDKYTWIDMQYGPGHAPLPFDASYTAKPAVAGIIDAWLGK